MSTEHTYAHFGSSAVFFVLGVFILASPVMRSGLSTRLALGIVTSFGQSQNMLLASVLGIAAIMSAFISAHAVAAILFPIVLDVIRGAGAKPGSKFSQTGCLAVAWGAIIGSNATLLGGARAPLALGILHNTTGITISFVQWTAWSLPIVLVLLLAAYGLLLLMGQDKTVSMAAIRHFLEDRTQKLGSVSQREVYTAGIMLLTIILWVMKGETWGLATIAFLGVLLAFVLHVTDWQEIEEDVNWGIFVMYGSAIALSAALRDTGAAAALAQHMLPSWIDSSAFVFVIVVFIALTLTEFMSHTPAVALLMPVALALAAKFGIDPRTMTLGVVVSAGLGFALPVSSPEIAMVVGSRYVRPSAILYWGLWLDLISFAVILVMSKLYWPLVGLR